MTENKVSCPKCEGNISFPTEMAGQTVPCPHCGESILLPKPKFPVVWIAVAALGLMVVLLVSALMWRSFSKPPNSSRQTPEPSSATGGPSEEAAVENSALGSQDPADMAAMNNICREYYHALNNRNSKAIHGLLSDSCRAIVPVEAFDRLHQDGSKFDFIVVESTRVQAGPLGLCAIARAKRRQHGFGGTTEGWKDFRFIKDASGWKLFRSEEITDAIEAEFVKFGFTDAAKANIRLLRNGDPFGSWDRNDTNVLASIFKLNHGDVPVFPWEFQFTISTNKVDRFSIGFDFNVRNTSPHQWKSPSLRFDLKSSGKVFVTDTAFLRDVYPGTEINGNASFFVKEALQETTKFDLDVYCSFNGKDYPLAKNLPIEFKIQKPGEQIKFEVVRTSFDLARTVDLDDMWSARIDYRVRNVGSLPVKDLKLKCVWSLMNGEILDQSSDYLVGYGDVPLSAGQAKSGFIRCGKGYTRAKVPVKVDVYLESDDKRSLVVRSLTIR